MATRPEDDRTEIRLTGADARLPWIEIISGPRGSGRFFLRAGKNLIGRSRENDVILEDSSVSRKHAVIDVTESGATITDLGSRNGTKVDGRKIDQSVTLAQDSRIKLGLYELRFLTQDAQAAEPRDDAEPSVNPAENPIPPEQKVLPPEGGENALAQVPEDSAALSDGLTQEFTSSPPQRNRKKTFLFGGLVLALLIAAAAGLPGLVKYVRRALPVLASKTEKPATKVPAQPQKPAPAAMAAESVRMPETAPGVQPVFLDFSSAPIPAQVYFGDRQVGTTPFRTSTALGNGKWYEARALFPLTDIGETLEERISFNSTEGASVIPVNFTARIGIFKVTNLPRDAQLYLEGYFERDPYRAKPVKFSEIIYGKPIYVPYGRYVMELKRSRQVADSQTYLDEVIYRREFLVTADQTNYTVDVVEDTLRTFPVQVSSIPAGAKVYVDEKEVGQTPFTGNFPVGEHLLAIKKDGFFDYAQPFRMEVNTPYVAEVTLKTSAAGELINRADALMKEDRYPEALPVLVEAFQKNPAPRETAQISYLVGFCYLKQKAYKEAQDYFLKAMEHEDFRYAGRLGVANLSFEQGDATKALQLLTEVLASSQDSKVRADAGTLFQKLSPLKSVLYVASEPPGARVFINGLEASQITPLIVHDLGVGSYRIQVKKDAYADGEVKVNLGVSEFRPVVIKLQRVLGYAGGNPPSPETAKTAP